MGHACPRPVARAGVQQKAASFSTSGKPRRAARKRDRVMLALFRLPACAVAHCLDSTGTTLRACSSTTCLPGCRSGASAVRRRPGEAAVADDHGAHLPALEPLGHKAPRLHAALHARHGARASRRSETPAISGYQGTYCGFRSRRLISTRSHWQTSRPFGRSRARRWRSTRSCASTSTPGYRSWGPGGQRTSTLF